MLITLIGRNSINKLNLPNEIMGNYWLYDKTLERRIVNIKNINNSWQIQSNNQYKIINKRNIIINKNSISIQRDGNEVLDKVNLKNYDFYYIAIENYSEIYVLYCSKLYENNFIHLHIKNTTTISIGKDKNYNQISYDNSLINYVQAEIFFLNGMYWIKNYDKRFNTYVNDKPIFNSSKILNNGDRIYMFGLTIIMINKELFINNPLNKVNWSNDYFSLNDNNQKVIKLNDEETCDKYNNNEFFFRIPRILDEVEKKEIIISSPQISEKNRELPTALVFGSTILMGTMTIVSIIQTLSNYLEGKLSTKNLFFSLTMSFIMLLSAVLIPIINRHYSTKIKRLNEQDTIERYRKYIENKTRLTEKLLSNNRSILYKTYVTPEECVEIILNNKNRLWERQINDDDFLVLRLGVGDVPSNLKVKYTIDEMADENNEIYKIMIECAEKAKIIQDAPVLISLVEKNISAILYKDELKYRYFQKLLIQLITFHSYDELKIVFLLRNNDEKKWDFVKMLPHVWSNSKTVRFFADTPNSISEVTEYLENELNKRVKQEHKEKNYKNMIPYYLIIVDDYKNVENISVINDILKSQQNMGFSILFITDSILKLPNECQTFINIEEKSGILFQNINPKQNRINFRINTSDIIFFDKISRILSEMVIRHNEEKEMQLPSSYTFLEMYNVGCIEQLNILERWHKNDSTVSLSVPIGIDGTGKHISLDIHEKFHGPHGLIAGSTGSGKSEFIITYILSLAVNYHPDDVTFVLIDYKGGGLAGAFERSDVQLPHVVGTITNIDKGNLQRSLESIESELKRRQIKFNEAKFITGESTIDIYKYQRYYHSGILKEPISHLFIISDEFAELKQQEPEFMDELISVARIGRSLGIHLILATQKPSGVVNDQIRSNTKFGICLKVQSPGDSKDVIGITDAAKLNSVGQFYLKVGNDDYLVLGKSAWAGALYYPSNEVKKAFDNSIEFISNTGKILKKVDDNKKNTSKSKGEQLTNLVRYISDLAKKENIHEKTLWLNPISETIYLSDIRKKYNVKVEKNIINPVIGEYDDPSRQLQNVLTLNISTGGNTIIYGNAESGKETLISTMIYDIITTHSSEVVQIYVLDFGSETMKIFKNAPQVGDVILASDGEKVARFFMMLQKELKERRQILSNYNGDYTLYIKSIKNVMPYYVIILNNYETFVENYPNTYEDILERLLREGLKYGFGFIFTVSTTTGLKYRMLQNFKQKIALQMNKDSDYSVIFDYIRNKRPSNKFGRGLVNLEEKKFYEFQTALICETENWNEKIMQAIEQQNKVSRLLAKEIPTVPELITINDLDIYIKGLSKFPIGISNKNITPCLINLKKDLITFMIANHVEDYNKFIINIIEEAKMVPNINLMILDAEGILERPNEDVKEKYIQFFKKLNNSKKLKDSLCIIIGIDKFINELGSEDLFFASLKNAQTLKQCYYIIMDSAIKFTNHTYSEWYKKYGSNENGIWLGNGVKEQYLFKPDSSEYKLLNTCGCSYGYVFIKGKPSLVKLLGMKEGCDEDE